MIDPRAVVSPQAELAADELELGFVQRRQLALRRAERLLVANERDEAFDVATSGHCGKVILDWS